MQARKEYYGLGGTWRVFVMGKEQPSQSHLLRPSRVVNPARMIALGDTPLHDYRRGIDSGFNELNGHPYGLPYLHEGLDYVAVQIEAGAPGLHGLSSTTADDRAAMRKRHNSWWNIGFGDGHVEQLRAGQFFRRDYPQQNALWNYDNRPH